MPSPFRNRVKSTDFRRCFELISPILSVGDFDGAFDKLKEFRIGPNTLNNADENFLFRIWEALSDQDSFAEDSNYIGSQPGARDHFLTMARKLIEQGADINQPCKMGMTLLQIAADSCTLDFCKLLLEYDEINVDQYDVGGETALDSVITSFYYKTDLAEDNEFQIRSELIRLLLLKGADPYRPYFNETTAPPTKYTKFDPYAWLKKDDKFFYKNPAHYVIEQSIEVAERYREGVRGGDPWFVGVPEFDGSAEEEPCRKIFFDTLKEMGKA